MGAACAAPEPAAVIETVVNPDAPKFAIVTGASRGYGKGAVKILASEGGYYVFCCARGIDKLEELKKEVEAMPGKGGKVFPYRVDQSRAGDPDGKATAEFVNAAFAAAKAAGAPGVSLLVNSAYQGLQAMTPHLGKPFWEMPTSTWDASFDIGPRSHFVMTRAVIPKMAEAGVKNGLIVSTSSCGGFMYVFGNAYSGSHFAMDRLMYDTAIELGSMEATNGTGPLKCKIRTASICLGAGSTDISGFPDGETPMYGGRAIMAMHSDGTTDEYLDKVNGRVVIPADMAMKTLAKDGIDGSIIIEKEQGPEKAAQLTEARYAALAMLPGPYPLVPNENKPWEKTTFPTMVERYNMAEVAPAFFGYNTGGEYYLKMA